GGLVVLVALAGGDQLVEGLPEIIAPEVEPRGGEAPEALAAQGGECPLVRQRAVHRAEGGAPFAGPRRRASRRSRPRATRRPRRARVFASTRGRRDAASRSSKWRQ